MKTKWLVCAVTMLVVVGFAASALAVPLLPGESHFKPGEGLVGPKFYTSALPAYVVAANLVDSMSNPMSVDFTGTVLSEVYMDPGDSTLLFLYQITNTTPDDAGSVVDLVRATMGAGLWKGVGISDCGSDGTGTSTLGGGASEWTDGDPNFLLRDPTASGEGLTIQFRAGSDGTVLRGSAGDFSSLIFFDTDATDYVTGNMGIIDSGKVDSVEVFAPGAVPGDEPIPEPASLLVFAGGLLGFAARKRRK
jgi:hypothetical protein